MPYPKPEDLGIGHHVVKVEKMPEFKKETKENGEVKNTPVEGSHKHGVSDKGFAWWMYSHKHPELGYITLFANESNKAWFDSGEVDVNVVQKIEKATKEPIYKVVEGKAVPVLTYFINQVENPHPEPENPTSGLETPNLASQEDSRRQAEDDLADANLPF